MGGNYCMHIITPAISLLGIWSKEVCNSAERVIGKDVMDSII